MPQSNEVLETSNRANKVENCIIAPSSDQRQHHERPSRWCMGILNVQTSHDVPGTTILLAENRENLNQSASTSTVKPQIAKRSEKKKTPDGRIVLDPQPEDSYNDPLNWEIWRKDAALLSLGIYCMVGGGMTPILAAGFSDVASSFNMDVAKVSLTTGLYMLGLGFGSVILSPTAILYGKRPVYLFSAVVYFATSIWCAKSSSFTSLILGRIFQGISVSPVECLPSATISEIFFLHERAYRIGIYSLLLLGGKNLVPLVSAAIIQSMSWRWVFWITAIIVAFCWCLLFLFLPETFWIRRGSSDNRSLSINLKESLSKKDSSEVISENSSEEVNSTSLTHTISNTIQQTSLPQIRVDTSSNIMSPEDNTADRAFPPLSHEISINKKSPDMRKDLQEQKSYLHPELDEKIFDNTRESSRFPGGLESQKNPKTDMDSTSPYVAKRRSQSKLSFNQLLRPWNGRLTNSSWLLVAFRPFVLLMYPAIIWSSFVYACSVGWLIVMSESITILFRSKETYGFSALSAGLIYISPFIGGIFGTAVSGIISDKVVQFMAKRNNNVFEPEFRLVMVIPTAITTVIGLMGLGWSVQTVERWIVPTVFFGIISFGCSLGAATAMTFCVDSYRSYAGEALVTLNFCKNIFHGLVFSLFVTEWIRDDGPKKVFMWLGIVQLLVMAFTIPMYVFGKRARMWTCSRNLMKNF